MLTIFSTSINATVQTKSEKEQQKIFNDESWPMFRHDATRTGSSTSNAPNTDKILWTYTPPLGTYFSESSPVVTNGRLYIGAINGLLSGKVICLDENTGDTIWTYDAGWVCSTPAVVNNKVYFGTFTNNKVHCIDATNGNHIWTYTTEFLIFSSPVVANEKVYIGCLKGKMYCINAETGTHIWDYQTGDLIISSPTLYNNKVYFGSTDSKFYCLNAENGSLIWKFKGGQIRSTPAIYDNKVYFGSGNKVYSLNAENGSKIWDFKTGADVISSPAIAYDKLYVGSYDKKLYCLNPQTGAEYWNYSAQEKIFASPAVADNKIYVSSGIENPQDGNIACLNAGNGTLIWSKQLFRLLPSSPTIANGKLFQSEKEGNLTCFCDNSAPNQPAQPDGPNSGTPGIEYEFKTSTNDLDGDKIRYGWDWNSDKEVDEWTSYYLSSEMVTTVHSWENKGIFFVRVIAEDENGFQSEWSKPLTVTMPRNKLIKNPLLLRFIETVSNIYQIIKNILENKI